MMQGEHTTGGSSKFWGNIAVGMLPIAKDTCRMLIQKRGENVNWGGTWGIIGGAIGEYGSFLDYETFHAQSKSEQERILLNAAKKELKEETGFNGKLQQPKVFYPFVNPADNFDYYNMACFVDSEFISQPEIGYNWESQDHQWVTIEELQTFGRSERFKSERLHPGFKEAIRQSQELPQLVEQCQQNRRQQ